MGVRGDLGSFPILFDVLYNMVKYWCHIVKSDGNNILLLESLKESEQSEKAYESFQGLENLFPFFINLSKLLIYLLGEKYPKISEPYKSIGLLV
jgi:hypothetical protein